MLSGHLALDLHFLDRFFYDSAKFLLEQLHIPIDEFFVSLLKDSDRVEDIFILEVNGNKL